MKTVAKNIRLSRDKQQEQEQGLRNQYRSQCFQNQKSDSSKITCQLNI